MSIKRITILLVLLFLLVSCTAFKKEATQTEDTQQQVDNALQETHDAETQVTDALTQTAPAQEPGSTITPLPFTVTPTVTPIPNFISTAISWAQKIPTFLIMVIAIAVFVFCLVLLLLLRRSRRLNKKGQSPKTGGKLPEVPPSPSETYGLRLVMASGGEIAVNKLPALIGRDKQKNDIVLLDDTVSAIHASLYYNRSIGKVCIEDCGSLNGLFVNERPTRKNVLEDGALIKLGATLLTFRDTGFIPSDQS